MIWGEISHKITSHKKCDLQLLYYYQRKYTLKYGDLQIGHIRYFIKFNRSFHQKNITIQSIYAPNKIAQNTWRGGGKHNFSNPSSTKEPKTLYIYVWALSLNTILVGFNPSLSAANKTNRHKYK